MHANAAYLAATMQTRRDYCSLRTIRKATAMSAAQVDNAMLQLQRAGMIETYDTGIYGTHIRYRMKLGMPGEVK
jgi:hypothetical protein